MKTLNLKWILTIAVLTVSIAAFAIPPLNHTARTCTGGTIHVSLAAVSGCSGIKVVNQGDWTVDPAPNSITYNGSSGNWNSIDIVYNTPASVVVSAVYSCTSGPGNEETASFSVIDPITPAVSLSLDASSLCTASNVTLTGTPTNGGNAPLYDFQIDGTSVYSVTPTAYTSPVSYVYSTSGLSVGPHTASVYFTNTTDCVTIATVNTSQGFTVYAPTSIGTLTATPNCNAGTVTITASALTATSATWLYQYSDNGGDTWAPAAWGTLSTTTASSVTQSVNPSGLSRVYRYQLTAQNGACASTTVNSAQVTAYKIPVGGTASTPTQICGSGSFAVGLSGHVGSTYYVKSQYQVGGGSWTGWTVDSTIPSVTTTSGVNRTYHFQAFLQNGDCTEAASSISTTTVYAQPVVGTISASATSFCSTGSLTIYANSLYGDVANWQFRYSDDNGSSYSSWANFSTSLSSPQAISVSTTGSADRKYEVRVQANNGLLCSLVTSSSIQITVNRTPIGGSLSATAQLCGSGNVILTPSGVTGTINRFMVQTRDYTSSWSAWSTWSSVGASTTQAVSTTAGVIRQYNFQTIVQSGTVCTEVGSSIATTTVYPQPTLGTFSATSGPLCSSSTITISTTSMYADATHWQYRYSENGGTSYIQGWTDFSTSLGLSQTFVPGNIPVDRVYQFQLIAGSGSCSAANSSVATVTVNSNNTGTVSPPLTEAYGVASGTFTVSGYVGILQKWQQSISVGSWTDAAGTNTTPAYNYSNISAAATQFRALITNGACVNNTSPVATLNIYTAPSITASATEMAIGSTILLTAVTSYSNLQWIKNGSDVSGATTATYTVTEPGQYQLKARANATAPYFTTGNFTIYSLGYLPDTTANKVVTTRIRKAGVSSATNLYTTLQTTDYAQGIVYSDALGRPKQSIAIGQSPAAKDIVQPFAYDSLSSLSYLPYVSTSRDGLNKATALSSGGSYTAGDQYAFYQQANLQRATSTAPYAKATIENSPLGRALEQGAPGTDWQPGSTHTVRPEFHTNGTSDVRIWSLSGPGSYYDPGTLVMSKVIDENGNIVYGFTDKMGRTILKRVQSATSTWLETYYVYDTRGNLVMQVPPKASAASWSTTIRDQYCFQYTYDVRNRLVEKITPGAAAIYYLYDPLGRLVLTQDGNLRTLSKWAFIKYDIKNRPVMSGLYSNTSNTTRPTMQANIVDPLYASGAWYEERGTTLHGYTNQSFPTTNSPSAPVEVLTVAYYDTYDFNYNGANDWTYTSQGISGEGSQDNSFGLPTGSKKLVIGDTAWIRTYQFYDRFGRVIQVRNNNHRSAVVDNLTTIVYDFEGKVLQTKTYHNAGGSNQTTTVTRNEYSNLGRLVRIYHSINGAQETVNAYYKYNELGQVVEKNLHCIDCGDVNPTNSSSAGILTRTAYSASEQNLLATQSVTLSPGFDTGVGGLFNARIIGTAATIPASGGTYMQSVDYRYHIRGWLQSINNAQLGSDGGTTNDDANDYFGLELAYNTDAGMSNTPFYNGNISAIKWKSNGASGAADQRSYKYSYDKSDKLLAATFQAHTGSAWTKEAGTLDETMTYDANGNILTLNRKQNQRSLSGINVMSTPQPLDDLSYTYAAGNQMSKVEDAVATTVGTGDFKNGSTNTTEYTYNTSGGMTQDLNKGISAITYNVLGKPSQITMSSGTVTNYTYDAAGTKLKMAVTVGGTTTTDYVGSFVYVNSALSFLSSPEGRVVKNGSKFEYQYAISDHQGNTRILFTSATPTPQVYTATLEDNTLTAEQSNFQNYPTGGKRSALDLYDHTDAGSTYTHSYLLNGGYNSQVGLAKSFKVYPGDKVKIEAYAKYSNPSSTTSNLAGFAAALLAAYGVSPPAGGESGTVASALNTWGGIVAGGGDGESNTPPHVSVNIVIFDKNYNFLDAAFSQISTSAQQVGVSPVVPHDYLAKEYTIKEGGYAFLYIVNENATQVDAYFDDVKMTYTPGNVIQSSEYYPFGMQTASSWTRDNVTGNNFLGNGGTELNTTSQVYDLDYRNYDPILGRMNQTDPLADQFSSLSPYHYSYNNPVGFNDPSGALPWSSDFAESYIGSDYGSRNAWAKMVAHGGMAQFVGGAGEGWDGYVGGFGLAENGFGVGASEPGPTVYSPWCGCRVSAFEVMSQDPVNQNASFRAKAQSAVDSYIDGGSRQKNIVDRVLDWLPGKRKNGTDVLVSGPTNIQIGIKRGASVTFNPISTVFRQKEWTNKSDNNSYIISDDANKRYHTEFGLDWGLGINYKNLIDTGDPYGTLDGTYKSDVSELTVSYFGLAVKFSWGTDGGAIFYGGNLGVGLGVGIGGSAETYHGNSIQLWDK